LSCSFWDENIEGSSAVIITSPASIPVYAAVMKESEATFNPTTFMNVKALILEIAAA
jgi:hypothetical protein